MTPVVSVVEAQTSTAAGVLVMAKTTVLFTAWLNKLTLSHHGTADLVLLLPQTCEATTFSKDCCFCWWCCNRYAGSDGNAIIIPDTSGAVTLDVKTARDFYDYCQHCNAGDILLALLVVELLLTHHG